MSTALINPEILRWAVERAHVSDDMLAKSAGIRQDKLRTWLGGEARPTFRQAQRLAHALKVPFGYLFLAEPPDEELPIPDLRTIGDQVQHYISPDLRDVLNDVLRKQGWYRDYLLEQGRERLSFVSKYTVQSRYGNVVDDIRNTLNLDVENREDIPNWELFLQLLMERAESAGIWVMRNGVVGSNTHRSLNVEEFRGFAISDPIAPLVFLNGNDAKAAQIFTLAHELAHIWIGESGISDFSIGNPVRENYPEIEAFCNRVAAELLVPEAGFRKLWDSGRDLSANADNLARYFRVSTVMIARRAHEFGFVKLDDFLRYYESESDKWQRRQEGGGNYYLNIRARNGKQFVRAVLNSTREGKLLLRDAGKLLNMNPSKIYRLASELGIE